MAEKNIPLISVESQFDYEVLPVETREFLKEAERKIKQRIFELERAFWKMKKDGKVPLSMSCEQFINKVMEDMLNGK